MSPIRAHTELPAAAATEARLPPSEGEIRAALLARAAEFSALTGMSRTQISFRATNDTAFLGQVEKGRNFTVALYQRALDWLAKNWPAPDEASPESGS